MTLAFLTPCGPPAESPLTAVAARAGATLCVRNGWLVPERFSTAELELRACRETVGWADACSRGKFELWENSHCRPGTALREHGVWTCSIARGRSLLIADPEQTASLAQRRGDEAIDVTAQYGALVLAGPAARETIARFCALDLRPGVSPPGAFLPGSVARTPGYVLCESSDRYLLLFGAALAEYLWTVVADAAEHLGGRPVGVDVLPRFEDPAPAQEPQHA